MQILWYCPWSASTAIQANIKSFRWHVISCPGQLNRWACDWLSDSVIDFRQRQRHWEQFSDKNYCSLQSEKIELWQWGLETGSQRVTWKAFPILSMDIKIVFLICWKIWVKRKEHNIKYKWRCYKLLQMVVSKSLVVSCAAWGTLLASATLWLSRPARECSSRFPTFELKVNTKGKMQK